MVVKTHRKSILVSSSLVAAALALSSCGSAAEKTTTQGDPSSSVVAGGATPTATASSEETPSPDAVKVEDYGFTQFPKSDFGPPTVTYGVIISNSGEQIATDVRVQIGIEDASGTVVDSRDEFIAAILPNTSVALAGANIEATGAKKMTVQALPGTYEDLEEESANFDVSKVKTRAQEFGSLKTTAAVASPFTKDLKDLQAVAIYKDAKGKVVGGDFTFLNFIPAKGKATVSIESYAGFKKAPAKTEVYIALSSLTLLE